MKNITHPLERLKRIADPVIRQQAVENFNESEYNFKYDDGTLAYAIIDGFYWADTPEGQGRRYWDDIYEMAKKGELELLPEPESEPSELTIEQIIKNTKEPINGGNIFDELEKLRADNEKLRECLKEFIELHEEVDIKPFFANIYRKAKQLLNQK